MKLTNEQIFKLAEAIAHLDGLTVIQVIEGKAVAIFKSYQLAHAARWLLARSQGVLQAAIADFNRAKDSLIRHHTGGGSQISTANSATFTQFVADLEKLKQEAVELPLDQVTLAQLKLEENEKAGNELPIAVLNALSPLIKN